MGNGREISGSLREEKKRKENSPEKELLVGGGGCRVSTGREEEAWSPEEKNGAGRVFPGDVFARKKERGAGALFKIPTH